jgi:hypothetical protein
VPASHCMTRQMASRPGGRTHKEQATAHQAAHKVTVCPVALLNGTDIILLRLWDSLGKPGNLPGLLLSPLPQGADSRVGSFPALDVSQFVVLQPVQDGRCDCSTSDSVKKDPGLEQKMHTQGNKRQFTECLHTVAIAPAPRNKRLPSRLINLE